MKSKSISKIINISKQFFKHEAASGIILMLCAVAAIVMANSGLAAGYEHILHQTIGIGYGEFSVSMSLLHWINDGLMVLFFFVVGMEIKRELLVGELKSIKKTILPITAALGGMVVPAVIYTLFNIGKTTSSGWGIPMATDIAFALGILSLVGSKKAPKGIIIFLTALAIVDDLGAIIVIAIFYTSQISWMALLLGFIVLCILIAGNRFNVKSTAFYIVFGLILWVCFLKSGIHATIAGVLLGMTIPGGKNEESFSSSLLYKLEHKLEPWSTFAIMPIFALANCGVTVNGENFLNLLSNTLSIGIMLGLFLGKQIGVFGTAYLLIKFKIAKLPSQVTLRHIYAASILAGIGFTMSLFVSSLAFKDEALISTAKLSIMVASILAAVIGIIIFKIFVPDKEKLEVLK